MAETVAKGLRRSRHVFLLPKSSLIWRTARVVIKKLLIPPRSNQLREDDAVLSSRVFDLDLQYISKERVPAGMRTVSAASGREATDPRASGPETATPLGTLTRCTGSSADARGLPTNRSNSDISILMRNAAASILMMLSFFYEADVN
jgi:hypothetical protein